MYWFETITSQSPSSEDGHQDQLLNYHIIYSCRNQEGCFFFSGDMKAPGFDGFTFMFYKMLCNVISNNILVLFKEFFKGPLFDLDQFYYIFIVHVP